jgi:iron-sulfur cluster insertion protein
MSSPIIVTPPTVSLTDNAVGKIRQLIEEEGNLRLMLRIFITGGGCSGFQYGFAFEDTVNEDDIVVEKAVSEEEDEEGGEGRGEGSLGAMGRLCSVKLLIDPMSYQYLVAATIDYKSDVSGEQFIINNPNATTTCGCGSSFSV